MKIVIFGANGPTGRLATRRVLAAGHRAVAVTRRPVDFPLADPRLSVVGADVREPGALADIVVEADAVLSALGVPFTRSRVDTYSVGMANVIRAMRTAGVRRVEVVSSSGAYPSAGRRRGVPLSMRLLGPIITRTIGKTVSDDIRRMEMIVRDSGLDWTIVRAYGLFDLPEPTNYSAGEIDPISGFTARIDLADCLVRIVTDSATIGSTLSVSTTEDTPTLWQVIAREAFKMPNRELHMRRNAVVGDDCVRGIRRAGQDGV
ncbi:NAD dependent epimerase/dehydratase family protein [Mycobacterium sp. JS623]|uniref:NAD(P)-dependent oxidoreductase n=1 Tax=Mycobacterium sp. JS623 TaxID=212767 RepID=UPI0002A5AEE0|nr:NAD(P)H-binding protein [Mycobacterium sp. JS623]AGB22234.1 NAD dependent epimerase/dehydratase family protein [Mycobacterium sp. JS623]